MKSRWMSFPQNTPIHAPILIHNWIGIHKISVDEFSKKHSDSYPENLQIRVKLLNVIRAK